MSGAYISAFKRRVTMLRRQVGIPASPTIRGRPTEAPRRWLQPEDQAVQEELPLA
jgi:hypothetical protein